MKGQIVKIIENDYGLEYGFIRSIGHGSCDYYFDNRYLSNGTMSDFYIDDIVEFEPAKHPHKPKQKIAKNVTLDLGVSSQVKCTNFRQEMYSFSEHRFRWSL